MKAWFGEFFKTEGNRLIYMLLAFSIAIGFCYFGEDGSDLVASGKTILIGLAMLFYNKARGVVVEGKEKA